MRASDVFVVQFIHPGGEHRPDHDRSKLWNEKAHMRKFMRTSGSYLDESGTERGESIVFWGEWEPPSRVIKEFVGRSGMPRFLYEPFYAEPSSYEGLQNTDPFVFGDHFFYTGCQQHTNRGRTETFLRWMAPGSLVLFGSCESLSHFVLDTAFVVRSTIDHHFGNYKSKLIEVPETYRDVTLNPWYSGGESDQSFRLYVSASPEDPIDGMFSFFPCSPESLAPEGFRRPRIELPGYVTPHLTQGKKGSRASTADVKEVWEQVRTQVLDQDLALGVRAQLPPKVNPT